METTNANKKGIASYWLVIMFVAISFGIVFITAGILYYLEPPVLVPTFEETAKDWENRIVKVVCEDEQSSGFIVESKWEDGENYLYIATTAHGVDHAPTNAKIYIAGEEYEAENLSVNSTIDIAIFKVECAGVYFYPTVAQPQIASEVMALGYPQNEEASAEIGYFNKSAYVDKNSASSLLCYEVSAYLQSGMSGCPILTVEGDLVGIGARTKIVNVDGQEGVFASDNYVVPAKILFAEYNRAVYHNTKQSAYYEAEMEDGKIVITVDDKKVVFENGVVTIDGKTVKKVAGKVVANVIDFVEQISYYDNRNSDGEVKVQLEDGEILLSVINE